MSMSYAEARSLSDEVLIKLASQSNDRMVRELANRHDVLVERLSKKSAAQSDDQECTK